VADADSELKGRIGRAAYVCSGLKHLGDDAFEADVEVDGGRPETPAASASGSARARPQPTRMKIGLLCHMARNWTVFPGRGESIIMPSPA